MCDVAVYGNLVIDTVIDGDTTYQTLGGIANVWDGFRKSDSNLLIEMVPTEEGSSLIHINRNNSTRISKSNLYERSRNPRVVNARAYYVGYLNELVDVEFMEKFDTNSTIFADVCSGKKLNAKRLGKVNVLFVSDTDYDSVVSDSLMDNDHLLTVVHGPSHSFNSRGDTFVLPEEMKVKNCNVLGAGDWFAANYINAYLDGMNPGLCLRYAHTKTSLMLGARNEN